MDLPGPAGYKPRMLAFLPTVRAARGGLVRGSLALAASVPLAALLLGCGLPDTEYFGHVPKNPDPTHLRWCNSGEPEYLDPGLVSSTTGVKLVYAMFDGLTDHNLQGLPEPSLATHWDVSPDQRRFTFHLHDKGRWSDGSPITAHDFVYHIVRVLHPVTGSTNAETHWKLKNAELFTSNRVKMVTKASGPFLVGDIVEVIGLDGEVVKDVREATFPDSNARTASTALSLRDFGAPSDAAYATVPAGSKVTIIEMSADRSWAYVHFDEDDGVYGWEMTAKLDGQPNGAIKYTVRAVPLEHLPRQTVMTEEFDLATRDAPDRQGVVTGADLLMLPEVLGVYARDDQTLVLETANPVPYMLDMSPQRAFRASPRKAVSRWPKKWTDPDKIITSGAFKLSEWKQRDYIRLKKSQTYWRKDEIKLETITAFSMNDQAASANYYFQGSCDAVTSNNIPSSYFPALNGEKRGGKTYKDYTAAPYLGIYIYLINTKKHPNVHFRRALNHAVDRAAMPRILHGGQIPTAQFMPGTPIDQLSDADLALCGVTRDTKGVASVMISGELCYVPPQGVDFDLAKAKEELEIARKELGDKFPKSITVKFNTGVEGHKLIAEYLQREWKVNLGIDVQLESQEWKTFLKDTRNGEFDVARMGWIGNFPDVEAEFLPQFKCDSPDNRTSYCSEEFEQHIKNAEATADRKERLKHAFLAEQTMVQDAPIIPLYVYTQHHLQKPYVRDLGINLPDQPPLRKAWIDPDWKKNLATKAAASDKKGGN